MIQDFLKMQESRRYQEVDADVKALEAAVDDISDWIGELVNKVEAKNGLLSIVGLVQVEALQEDTKEGVIDPSLLGNSWNERSAKSLVRLHKKNMLLSRS